MRVESRISAFVLPGRGDLPGRIGEDGTEPILYPDGAAKGVFDGIDAPKFG